MDAWNDWSDLEVNTKIAEVQNLNFEVISGLLIVGLKHEGDNVTSISGAMDYCNRWDQMGQIIDQYNIAIGPSTSGRKMAASYRGGFDDINVFDKSQLRAAAIVFLMMNGVKP